MQLDLVTRDHKRTRITTTQPVLVKDFPSHVKLEGKIYKLTAFQLKPHERTTYTEMDRALCVLELGEGDYTVDWSKQS